MINIQKLSKEISYEVSNWDLNIFSSERLAYEEIIKFTIKCTIIELLALESKEVSK